MSKRYSRKTLDSMSKCQLAFSWHSTPFNPCVWMKDHVFISFLLFPFSPGKSIKLSCNLLSTSFITFTFFDDLLLFDTNNFFNNLFSLLTYISFPKTFLLFDTYKSFNDLLLSQDVNDDDGQKGNNNNNNNNNNNINNNNNNNNNVWVTLLSLPCTYRDNDYHQRTTSKSPHELSLVRNQEPKFWWWWHQNSLEPRMEMILRPGWERRRRNRRRRSSEEKKIHNSWLPSFASALTASHNLPCRVSPQSCISTSHSQASFD